MIDPPLGYDEHQQLGREVDERTEEEVEVDVPGHAAQPQDDSVIRDVVDESNRHDESKTSTQRANMTVFRSVNIQVKADNTVRKCNNLVIGQDITYVTRPPRLISVLYGFI